MKYNVNMKFYGLKEERMFDEGEQVELTKTRAKEINKTLAQFDDVLTEVKEVEKVEEVEKTENK